MIVHLTAHQIIDCMQEMRCDAQREVLMRFFKTGLGQYGEGDQFLGIKVPDVRLIARKAIDLSDAEIPTLLLSPWHEIRLCGFLILTYQMELLNKKRVVDLPESIARREAIVQLYLQYAEQANNWDLVDLSAPKVIGTWAVLCANPTTVTSLLDQLADSPNLWLQRIAVVSTWKTTQQGNPTYAIRYATKLLHHPHDLMHKAVGWMLREVGKRGHKDLLEAFLEEHASTMPRTTLRYAIELLPESERQFWLKH